MATMMDVDEVARRLDAGERANAIAADLGGTPRTIRTWLHAAGLPLASTRSRERRLAFSPTRCGSVSSTSKKGSVHGQLARSWRCRPPRFV